MHFLNQIDDLSTQLVEVNELGSNPVIGVLSSKNHRDQKRKGLQFIHGHYTWRCFMVFMQTWTVQRPNFVLLCENRVNMDAPSCLPSRIGENGQCLIRFFGTLNFWSLLLTASW